MIAKGIRISDKKNGKCIPLSELLINMSDLDSLNWALLWFDVTPIENEGKYISALSNQINISERGFLCSFKSLIEISKKISQEIEVLLVGCELLENLRRYKEDQEMYENCDIVIEMIDGGFWEVFSKNINLINNLAKKYKETEFLTSDFQNEE